MRSLSGPIPLLSLTPSSPWRTALPIMPIKGATRPSDFLLASSSSSITPEHPCSQKEPDSYPRPTLDQVQVLSYHTSCSTTSTCCHSSLLLVHPDLVTDSDQTNLQWPLIPDTHRNMPLLTKPSPSPCHPKHQPSTIPSRAEACRRLS